MAKTLKKLGNHIETNKNFQMYIISLLALFQVVENIRNPFVLFSDWQSTELTVNYTYGFVRRGFMGSITYAVSQIFSLDYAKAICIVQFIGEIIFVALFLSFLYRVLRKTDDLAIGIILVVSMNVIGFYVRDWGELDIFMISLTIIMLYLLFNNRCLWLIPIIAGICECIHEGYALMYFGIIFSALLYKAFIENDKKKKKYLWAILLLTGALVSCLFLYFYFFSKINVPFEKMYENIHDEIGDIALYYNLAYIYNNGDAPLLAMWLNNRPTLEFIKRMMADFLNLIVCLPMIVMAISFWKRLIADKVTIKNKLKYSVIPLFGFLILPLVFIQTDQARWFYDFVLFELFLISFVAINEDSATIKKCCGSFKHSSTKLILFCIYFVAFVSPEKQLISYWYSHTVDIIIQKYEPIFMRILEMFSR